MISDRLPFEYEIPGTWLRVRDEAAKRELEALFLGLERAFHESVMAWLLFSEARVEPAIRVPSDAEMDAQFEERRSILSAVLESSDPGFASDPHQTFQAASIEVERQLVRREWSRGVLPQAIAGTRVFLLARGFLYSAAHIGSILRVLAGHRNYPVFADDSSRFEAAFPDLRDVRNSAAHPEDRVRGIGLRGEMIDAKGIVQRGSDGARADVLFNSILAGDRFGTTMHDGFYGEVSVSEQSVCLMRDLIEDVLSSVPWSGPRQIKP